MPLLDNYVGQIPGAPVGNAGSIITSRDWVRLRQPFIDNRGRGCVTITDVTGAYTRNDSHGGEPKPLLRTYLVNDLRNQGHQLPMVCNAATLRKEEWIAMDMILLREARSRLRAAADLEAASNFPMNGMSRMTLEYQAMSDPGEAVVDMDGRTDARVDTPLHIIRSLPLPITHSDFGYSDRELQVSRNTGTGLDMTMGEVAARRVGESVEDQVIGNVTGATYGTQTAGPGTHTGTSTVYGYTNFTYRLTKTNMTVPTTTNGPTSYGEVLTALNQLFAQNFYGPFVLYHSTDWTTSMNSPFTTAGGNHPSETLRTMLMKNPDIRDVRRLDRLTSTYTLIFAQLSSDVAQMVSGLDFNTIQWDEKGGLDHRFKHLAIKTPRLRATYASRTGILVATTA